MADMPPSGFEFYRGSFARRTAATMNADLTTVDQPGVCGIYGTAEHPGGRVLITDDRAAPLVEAMMPNLYPRVVNVFHEAVRCTDLVRQSARWQSGEPATAMVCRDLSRVPPPTAMPDGLWLRCVRRVPSDPDDGVTLERAAQACLDADPQMAGVSLPGFLDYLRSLPPTTRLLAAVDGQDVVRATAGCSAQDGDASAFFVNTDPRWRGRGVATAMTASALAWGYGSGARTASLDASPAGLSIYLWLGFEPVSPTTLFSRLAP